MSDLLKLSALNQFYGASHTLWDIEMAVPGGQCTCIMGRNGVGKTTLLQCIMGLLPLQSARWSIRGRILSSKMLNNVQALELVTYRRGVRFFRC